MRIFLFLLLLLSFGKNTCGQPLFQLKSATETGVDFNNRVTDEQEHNILIYSNYYGGAGVGIGDINNDGLADLFFAGNLVGDQLYLNEGNFKFKDITTSANIIDNGGWSSGVVMADINNDGWLDIYVTRELYDDQPDLRRNQLYINNQNNTFTEAAASYGIDNSERTRHATFFDYDRDGFLDLYLLNQPPNPGNYSPLFGSDLKQEQWMPRLYRNTGKGQFEEVTEAAGLLRPGFTNSVVAADFNKDGWTDLYVTNDYEAPDWLFLNQQDGTFKEVLKKQLGHSSFYSMGVDAADINNDAWPDLMTLDMVAEDNYRLKANMGGMYPEAFWKVVNDGGHYQYMFNALQLHQGHGNTRQQQFSDIAQLAGISNTDWSWANLIADFDNDGHKDIFVTNGLLRDIRNSDAARSFPDYVQKVIERYLKENPNAGQVSIFDVLDVADALRLIPSVPLANYAYHNQGDLTFGKRTKEWGLDQKSFSNGAAYGDLDNDGDLDLVVNNINQEAFLYENKSTDQNKNNYLRIQLEAGERPILGTKISIRHQGQQQYIELSNVRGMYSTCEQIAHFGLGKHTSADISVTWPDGRECRVDQVPANQTLRIRYERESQIRTPQKIQPVFQTRRLVNFRHRENTFNDFEKQVLLPHRMSQFGPALAKGDLNGDGRDDLYIGGAAGQAGQIFLQTSGTLQNPQALSVASFKADQLFEDVGAAIFDADQDGDQDLYVVSGGNANPAASATYQDRLYLNDGQGSLRRASDALPDFRESGSCVRPFDFDQDGDLDLFVGGRHVPWQYPTPSSSRLLRNDGGRFVDISQAQAPMLNKLGMVTDAVWTDFDQDGWTDLVVLGEWMPITFLRNQQGTFVKSTVTDPDKSGWWYSIHAADFDGDGDEDLVAGNLGLNYKYKASAKEPFEVHYADFDENGQQDIVLSYYNFGEQFPL
ncbi:MAG: FG-GAP-like repeat-containing protein, partial [Bacteroidota bacterium]